jgi:predicted dehydrogenase
MTTTMTRRTMLKRSALSGVGVSLAPVVLRAQESSPNEKLNLAVIGCGNRGRANLNGVAGENLVALCDVDLRQAKNAYERFPKAKKYKDFRRMLDEVHAEIDAVVVSTPDHTHYPAAMTAMDLGKHLYCEKPMAHTVTEVRKMTEKAREKKLTTQLGTQIHAGSNYRRVVELIRAGAIGEVGEVHVWHTVDYGNREIPTETPPVPSGLDWNLWLGPAETRPYHPTYLPGTWRHWWDFSNGGLGDFGCHYMDLPFWALDLKYPETVAADGPELHPETTSPGLRVRYTYPRRGKLPPLTMTWYDAGRKPDFLEQRGIPDWKAAVLFLGSEGMLISDYNKHRLLPEEEFADFIRPEPTIPESIGHHQEWIRACKTGESTTCRFDYSGPLSETVLLGNVAYRSGCKLRWNGEKFELENCPSAEAYLDKTYREGWKVG